MPVREAVHRLVADQALELSSNRALRVPMLTVSQFREITCIRVNLESLATARAATLFDEASLRDVQALHERFSREISLKRPDASGSATRLIDELLRQGKRDLTVIANDSARPGISIGKLITAGSIGRLVTSHIGTNPETQKLMLEGWLQVELVPQGTLAERIRAGGVGVGGVLTPTGVGTLVAQGKQTLEIQGRLYLLELALRADFSLIRAKRADYLGNLEYALTARNFNPLMAMASDKTIAEAEDIVPGASSRRTSS